MLVILSPAKTQDFNEERKVKTHAALFGDEVTTLIKKLRTLKSKDIEKLMSISPKLAELNFERFKNFGNTPEKAAILAYQGDVYQGLAADTFSLDDLKFADQHLLILSGLYGALRPLDAMQPYRLEMGIKLASGKHKDLYQFWHDSLNAYIKQRMQKQKILINLASDEYSKALDLKNLEGQVIKVDFKDLQKDSYKIIALFAKKARGMMANFIIKNRITEVNDLKKFNLGDYQFMPKLSNQDHFIFHRG